MQPTMKDVIRFNYGIPTYGVEVALKYTDLTSIKSLNVCFGRR